MADDASIENHLFVINLERPNAFLSYNDEDSNYLSNLFA